MKLLLKTLDEALDDVEQGKVQTLEEAWVEIDNIYSGGKNVRFPPLF